MVKLTSPLINKLGKYAIIENNVLAFFRTGSGIEFVTTSSDVYLTVESIFGEYDQEIWITIEVDGALIQRINLPLGVSTICAYRKAEPGIPRTIRVLRESQEDTNSKMNAFCLRDIHSKNNEELELLPPPSHDLSIEVIGDSLTSGEGLNGKTGEMSFISAFYGFKNNYACLLADALNADFSVCSQSGWGVYCGYNGSLDMVIPNIYFDTAINGLTLFDDHAKKDYIIINLGTNDCISFKLDEWTDPATGRKNKMHLNDDGSMNADDVQKIIDAGITFTQKIKELNPDTKIIWVNGMLGQDMIPAIQKISAETDSMFVRIPEHVDMGSREHPGIKSHKAAADAIIAAVAALK